MCSTLLEDEAESPQLNPPPNVIDLDLEAIIIQVLPRRLFVPPPPLSKNMFQVRGFLLLFSWATPRLMMKLDSTQVVSYLMILLSSSLSRLNFFILIAQISCLSSLVGKVNVYLCVLFYVRLILCICTHLFSPHFIILSPLTSLRLMC